MALNEKVPRAFQKKCDIEVEPAKARNIRNGKYYCGALGKHRRGPWAGQTLLLCERHVKEWDDIIKLALSNVK